MSGTLRYGGHSRDTAKLGSMVRRSADADYRDGEG